MQILYKTFRLRWLFVGFSVLLMGLVLNHPDNALAQTTTTSVSGTITDASKAAIPNVKVIVRNESTRAEAVVTSNAIGFYTATNLQPGIYSVLASAPGFETAVLTSVHLEPNIGSRVDIALKLGGASTTVTVEANSNALQTESAAVGQLITSEQVSSIQLNGRNPLYLSQLEPGVTRNAPLTSFNFTPDFGGPQINGARNDEILITLDGAPTIRTRANGTTTGVPDTDTISQVQVLSTTYPAQYGGTSGGVIVQVPKTGTSQFHGSAYEYLRNSFFNANTWQRNSSTQASISQHPSPFRYNQFGWNGSGPIFIPNHFNKDRSKFFFLLGQEYVRYRQNSTQTGTVPTELMRTGNFSELLGNNIFYSSVKQIVNPTTGVAYSNNVITSNLSSNGLGLLKAYPAPNENAASYNWQDSAANPENQRKDTLVLDYLPTPSHQFRFSLLNFNYNDYRPFSGNFNLTPETWNWPDQVAVLHYTWTVNPHIVNDFTASASADHVSIDIDTSNGLYDRTQYGINYNYLFSSLDKLLPNKIPTINIANFTTLSGEPYPSHSGGEVVNFADNLTLVHGQHTLTFGGLWQYSGENNFDQISVSQTTAGATNNQNGQFIFTDTRDKNPSTSVAVANAALGLFDTYGEIGQKSYTLFRANVAEFFAQDQWHATPKLLVEAGARWTIIQPYYAIWRNQSFFSPVDYKAAEAPTISRTNGIASGGDSYDGVVIPGDGFPSSAKGHVSDSVLSNYSRLFRGYGKGYHKTVLNGFQPRFGFTYQMSPGTVVRAGAGRFIQHTGINDEIQLGGNSPFQLSETITAGSVDNPGGTTSNSWPLSLSSEPYDMPNPEAWAWTVSAEREINNFGNLTLSYVGRRGIHLPQLGELNQLKPGTVQANPSIATDALRPYQGFSTILEASNRGSSIYQGVQAGLKRSMTKNLSFGVAYTWSKLMDYGSSRGYELPNYYDSSVNYGHGDFDIRHVLVVNYVWNIPYAAHSSSQIVRHVFGNWQVSGVTQVQSGEPFSVSTSDDYAGVGTGAGDQLWSVAGKPALYKKFAGTSSQKWFDTTAFSEPTSGTFAGRGSRNATYGPGFQSWNIALLKSIHLVPGHENQVMNFKAEAFNFTNHPNLDTPDTDPTSGTFGEITTKGGTYSSDRELQFSLRYQF